MHDKILFYPSRDARLFCVLNRLKAQLSVQHWKVLKTDPCLLQNCSENWSPVNTAQCKTCQTIGRDKALNFKHIFFVCYNQADYIEASRETNLKHKPCGVCPAEVPVSKALIGTL